MAEWLNFNYFFLQLWKILHNFEKLTLTSERMNIRRYILSLLLLFGCILSVSAEVRTNVPRAGDVVCALEAELRHYDAAGKGVEWDFSSVAVGDKVVKLRYFNFGDTLIEKVGSKRSSLIVDADSGIMLTGFEDYLSKVRLDNAVCYQPKHLFYGYQSKLATKGEEWYCDKIYHRINAEYSLEVDGIGTLITPESDTLSNMVRTHLKIVLRDSVGEREIRRYRWLAPGYRYPIFDYTIGDNAALYISPNEQLENNAYDKDYAEQAKAYQQQDVADSGFSYEANYDASSKRITINITSEIAIDVEALLCNAMGMVYASKRISGSSGDTIELDCSTVPGESYVVYLRAGNQVYVEKFK